MNLKIFCYLLKPERSTVVFHNLTESNGYLLIYILSKIFYVIVLYVVCFNIQNISSFQGLKSIQSL